MTIEYRICDTFTHIRNFKIFWVRCNSYLQKIKWVNLQNVCLLVPLWNIAWSSMGTCNWDILDMSPNGLMRTNLSLCLTWASHCMCVLPAASAVWEEAENLINNPLNSSFSFSRCTWFMCRTDRLHLLSLLTWRRSFHLVFTQETSYKYLHPPPPPPSILTYGKIVNTFCT